MAKKFFPTYLDFIFSVGQVRFLVSEIGRYLGGQKAPKIGQHILNKLESIQPPSVSQVSQFFDKNVKYLFCEINIHYFLSKPKLDKPYICIM